MLISHPVSYTHLDVYKRQQYWQKSKVVLPDLLFEKNWYLTNYLFASCSRKGSYPMPLQGVWTADAVSYTHLMCWHFQVRKDYFRCEAD